MILQAIAFYVFAIVTVAAAFMVIAAKNPVHSVLFLILAFVNAAAGSTAEANGFLLRRYLKCPCLRRAFRLDADAAAIVDSQPIDERPREPDRHQSALYDLAASNPHVIAASLFTRKHR